MTRDQTREEFAQQILARRSAYRIPPPDPNMGKYRGISIFTQVSSQVSYDTIHFDRRTGFEAFIDPVPIDVDLGHVAFKAMSASRFITPSDPDLIRFATREEFKAMDDALKRRAGVKTIKALYDGAASVMQGLQGGVIEVSPWINVGNGGWRRIREHGNATLPEDAGDADLGAAINAAIAVGRAATEVYRAEEEAKRAAKLARKQAKLNRRG